MSLSKHLILGYDDFCLTFCSPLTNLEERTAMLAEGVFIPSGDNCWVTDQTITCVSDVLDPVLNVI
jgi:hypothetical protein